MSVADRILALWTLRALAILIWMARNEVSTYGVKRYVRRDGSGKFSESADQGRALSHDSKRSVKGSYSLPNGDRIVTIRRDILNKAFKQGDKGD